MDWKTLESLVHDHSEVLAPERVQELSNELLSSVSTETKPLQAVKVAYVLVLLQLRLEKPDQSKAVQFLDYLENILQHEIQQSEEKQHQNEPSRAHLIYVRKLTEHYFHHLLMSAELAEAKKVSKKIHAFRKKNHDELMKIQNPLHSFWKKEQKLIQRAVSKHYLFAGFLLSIALYFSWTTFWELSDFAMSQWVYTEYSADSISFLMREGLLLIFSISFVGAFVRYQGVEEGE
jgi:hypothetical protein